MENDSHLYKLVSLQHRKIYFNGIDHPIDHDADPNQVYTVNSTVHFDDKASDDKAMNVEFTKNGVHSFFNS